MSQFVRAKTKKFGSYTTLELANSVSKVLQPLVPVKGWTIEELSVADAAIDVFLGTCRVEFPPGTLGVGLGYQSESNSMVVVKDILPECPQADKIQVGDTLVYIDDWPLDGRSLQEIIERLGKNRYRSRILRFTRT